MSASRKNVVIISVGLIIAAVLVVVLWPGEREPEYQGKKLSEWISYALGNLTDADLASTTTNGWKFDKVESEESRKAVQAVRNIGTNGIPYLMEWLNQEESTWHASLRLATYRYRGPHGFDNYFSGDKSEARKEMAICGFSIMGKHASSAIPLLNDMMTHGKSPWIQRRGARALAAVGTDGLPALTAALTNKNNSAFLRVLVAENLELMGTDALPTVSALRRAMDDDGEPVVRNAATNALLRIAPEVLTNAVSGH